MHTQSSPQVAKDGVTHLAWLPGSAGAQRLLLAAGDKGGRVSLWDVDGAEGPAADTDGGCMCISCLC